MSIQSTNEVVAIARTHRRTLSSNELSYFLPSRAYGLNDTYNRIIFHAPPSLVSPLRVHIAWAIIRLRHSLMACRVEMSPGKYDEAQFVLRLPSSPSDAVAQAASSLRSFDDVPGTRVLSQALNGPRVLSSDRLSSIHIALHGEVSPGIHEFHFVYMLHHMINDSIAMYRTQDLMCELLGGSETPGGLPRTDFELGKILEREWTQRCGAQRIPHHAIIPSAEDRIQGRTPSKFRDAAWMVDNENIQKRFIGGHVVPRLKRTNPKNRLAQLRWFKASFDVAQTSAIIAQCKAKRVTLANAMFVVISFAWIRLCASRPDLTERKDLPMLMYTAINLQRYLRPTSPLDSYISLALEYHNVVLPAFIPRDIDPVKIFWARGREAQRQMFRHAHSPLLLNRAVVTGKLRGQRAKAWARLDDEADGTLPPTRRTISVPSPKSDSGQEPPPALALVGLSNVGDSYATVFRPQLYPSIAVQEVGGIGRGGPGGMIFQTRTFKGRFSINLVFDEPAFTPGLVEDFWRLVVDGLHVYVLGDKSLVGTAQEIDYLADVPSKAAAKL
ncbi:hypothetical protein R3P38DRAFT_2690151 [Favolaschia claudopus]|uniref:Condensation domain-containing protein n=1 Tax=Favolaschia claudopus TaxID=2862362 RepID=A0AAW0D1A9_9AGAR